MDKRIEHVENLMKQIEAEKDFLRAADLFAEAAPIIKQLLAQGAEAKGKVLEIIKELDEYIEREIKVGGGAPC